MENDNTNPLIPNKTQFDNCLNGYYDFTEELREEMIVSPQILPGLHAFSGVENVTRPRVVKKKLTLSHTFTIFGALNHEFWDFDALKSLLTAFYEVLPSELTIIPNNNDVLYYKNKILEAVETRRRMNAQEKFIENTRKLYDDHNITSNHTESVLEKKREQFEQFNNKRRRLNADIEAVDAYMSTILPLYSRITVVIKAKDLPSQKKLKTKLCVLWMDISGKPYTTAKRCGNIIKDQELLEYNNKLTEPILDTTTSKFKDVFKQFFYSFNMAPFDSFAIEDDITEVSENFFMFETVWKTRFLYFKDVFLTDPEEEDIENMNLAYEHGILSFFDSYPEFKFAHDLFYEHDKFYDSDTSLEEFSEVVSYGVQRRSLSTVDISFYSAKSRESEFFVASLSGKAQYLEYINGFKYAKYLMNFALYGERDYIHFLTERLNFHSDRRRMTEDTLEIFNSINDIARDSKMRLERKLSIETSPASPPFPSPFTPFPSSPPSPLSPPFLPPFPPFPPFPPPSPPSPPPPFLPNLAPSIDYSNISTELINVTDVLIDIDEIFESGCDYSTNTPDCHIEINRLIQHLPRALMNQYRLERIPGSFLELLGFKGGTQVNSNDPGSTESTESTDSASDSGRSSESDESEYESSTDSESSSSRSSRGVPIGPEETLGGRTVVTLDPDTPPKVIEEVVENSDRYVVKLDLTPEYPGDVGKSLFKYVFPEGINHFSSINFAKFEKNKEQVLYGLQPYRNYNIVEQSRYKTYAQPDFISSLLSIHERMTSNTLERGVERQLRFGFGDSRINTEVAFYDDKVTEASAGAGNRFVSHEVEGMRDLSILFVDRKNGFSNIGTWNVVFDSAVTEYKKLLALRALDDEFLDLGQQVFDKISGDLMNLRGRMQGSEDLMQRSKDLELLSDLQFKFVTRCQSVNVFGVNKPTTVDVLLALIEMSYDLEAIGLDAQEYANMFKLNGKPFFDKHEDVLKSLGYQSDGMDRRKVNKWTRPGDIQPIDYKLVADSEGLAKDSPTSTRVALERFYENNFLTSGSSSDNKQIRELLENSFKKAKIPRGGLNVDQYGTSSVDKPDYILKQKQVLDFNLFADTLNHDLNANNVALTVTNKGFMDMKSILDQAEDPRYKVEQWYEKSKNFMSDSTNLISIQEDTFRDSLDKGGNKVVIVPSNNAVRVNLSIRDRFTNANSPQLFLRYH